MIAQKLSLVIEAKTQQAAKAIDGLQNRLDKLSTAGGLKGFLGSGLSAGLGAVKMGAAGLGGTLGLVAKGFSVLGSAGSAALGLITAPLRLLTHAVGRGLSFAVGIGKSALLGLGAVAGAVGGAVWAGMKALDPAAYRETAKTSWEVMLGSKGKADKRMDFLGKFNAVTPFDFRELDKGARLMQTFGIYSQRNLRVLGDAVSAFGKRIEEAVGPLAKLKQGMWETEALAAIGVTREAMMGQGVKFGKQGELLTPGPEAFEAAIRYFEKRFGGLMARMAQTWTGLKSTFAANWDEMWAAVGSKALEPAKSAMREMIGLVADLTTKAAGIEMPWLDNLVAGAKMLRGFVTGLADPERRGQMFDAAKGAAGKVPDFLAGLSKALARDFGTVFENAVGLFRPAFEWLVNGFRLTFRYGAALFGEMLAGFSGEFTDKLGIMFHKIVPGGTQAGRRYEQATEKSMVEAMGQAAKMAGISPMAVRKIDTWRDTNNLKGDPHPGDYVRWAQGIVAAAGVMQPKDSESLAMVAQARNILANRNRLYDAYNVTSAGVEANTRRRMGWGGQTSAGLNLASSEELTLGNFLRDGWQLGKGLFTGTGAAKGFLGGEGRDMFRGVSDPIAGAYRSALDEARKEETARKSMDWFEGLMGKTTAYSAVERKAIMGRAAKVAPYLSEAGRLLGVGEASMPSNWRERQEGGRITPYDVVRQAERMQAEESPAKAIRDVGQEQLQEQRQVKAATYELNALMQRVIDQLSSLSTALVGA